MTPLLIYYMINTDPIIWLIKRYENNFLLYNMPSRIISNITGRLEVLK